VATLYLDPKHGTWYVSYYHRGQRYRMSLRTKDRRVARQLKAQIEADMINERLGRLQEIRLSTAVEEFHEFHSDRRLTTRRKNKYKLRLFVRWLGRDPLLDEIATETLLRYKLKRAAQVAGGTVLGDMIMLGAFFNWAVEMGYLYRTPLTRAVRKVHQVQRRAKFALTSAERADYEVALQDSPLLPVFLVGTYAGLRRKEIAHLEVTDIRDGRIVLQNKPHLGSLLKNCHARAIPVLAPLQPLMASLPSRGPVCPSPEGKYWDVDNLTHAWRGLMNELRMKPERPARTAGKYSFGVTLHELRHTFASLHIQEMGTDIYRLQRWMGHSDISTTAGYFQFFDP